MKTYIMIVSLLVMTLFCTKNSNAFDMKKYLALEKQPEKQVELVNKLKGPDKVRFFKEFVKDLNLFPYPYTFVKILENNIVLIYYEGSGKNGVPLHYGKWYFENDELIIEMIKGDFFGAGKITIHDFFLTLEQSTRTKKDIYIHFKIKKYVKSKNDIYKLFSGKPKEVDFFSEGFHWKGYPSQEFKDYIKMHGMPKIK